MSRIRLPLLILTIAIPLALMAPGAAQAAPQVGPDYDVNTFSDGAETICGDQPGQCSLRSALLAVYNQGPNGINPPFVGHIQLPTGTPYQLSSVGHSHPYLELFNETIDFSPIGPGNAEIIGADGSPVFALNTSGGAVTSTFDNLTIKHNLGEVGGGINANVQTGNAFSVTLNDSLITGNTALGGSNSGSGGGINVQGDGTAGRATVTVNNTDITDNKVGGGSFGSGDGGFGGGISALTNVTLNIANSDITGNTAQAGTHSGGRGGAIYAANSATTIDGSTIDGNTAEGFADTAGNSSDGGAMILTGSGSTTAITQSTISNNTAEGDAGALGGATAGGIDASVGDVDITNSTIAGNEAEGSPGVNVGTGGGLTFSNLGSLDFKNVTLASNTAGGDSGQGGNLALFQFPATAYSYTFDNTIISDGVGGSDQENCFNGFGSAPTLAGVNIEDRDTCGLGVNDNPDTDPQLGALALNGGATETMDIPETSPALGAATGCPPPAFDQRGTARPQGTSCDIGAFELEAANPALVNHASAAVTLGGAVHDDGTFSGGNAATGQITFTLYGPNDSTCAGAPVFTNNQAVTGDATYPSASFTPTATGTYRWIATYSGDELNNPDIGSCNRSNSTVTVNTVPVVPPVTPPADYGGGGGGTTPITLTLSLKTVKAKKGTIALDAAVSGAGSVTAKQDIKKPLVGPVTVEATKAGAVQLTLRPNKAGKKKLKKLKKSKKLTVEITVSFKAAGSNGFVTKKTFGQLAGKK